MPHPVDFRSHAYRALIRSLGESDAAVEWIEVGVREIQLVNETKGGNAVKKYKEPVPFLVPFLFL